MSTKALLVNHDDVHDLLEVVSLVIALLNMDEAFVNAAINSLAKRKFNGFSLLKRLLELHADMVAQEGEDRGNNEYPH